MKRQSLALLLVVALIGCGEERVHHEGSQPSKEARGTPGWIVDQYYGWTSFPLERLYVTPAFVKAYGNLEPIGAQAQTDVTVSSRMVREDSTRAAYATTMRDSHQVNDFYTFLIRDSTHVWKIDAIRNIAFPTEVYELLAKLQIGQTVPDQPPTLLGILRLAISSDSAVKRYLTTHADTIAAIASGFAAQHDVTYIDIADSLSKAERRGAKLNDPNATLRKRFDHAFVSAVFRLTQYPGCTFVRIGGVKTTQVGYIYAPDGCQVPQMSPGQFMLIEPIQPHWYEYKAQ